MRNIEFVVTNYAYEPEELLKMVQSPDFLFQDRAFWIVKFYEKKQSPVFQALLKRPRPDSIYLTGFYVTTHLDELNYLTEWLAFKDRPTLFDFMEHCIEEEAVSKYLEFICPEAAQEGSYECIREKLAQGLYDTLPPENLALLKDFFECGKTSPRQTAFFINNRL